MVDSDFKDRGVEVRSPCALRCGLQDDASLSARKGGRTCIVIGASLLSEVVTRLLFNGTDYQSSAGRQLSNEYERLSGTGVELPLQIAATYLLNAWQQKKLQKKPDLPL